MKPSELERSKSKTFQKEPLKIMKTMSSSEYPSKIENSQIHELSVCARTENRAEDSCNEVNEFHTGLSFVIPSGYYLEISGHPSLTRSGYMFTGPYLIDQGCTAELLISLYKFKDSDDIELPFVVAKCVLKVYELVFFTAVTRKHGNQQTHSEYDPEAFEKENRQLPITQPTRNKKVGKNASFF